MNITCSLLLWFLEYGDFFFFLTHRGAAGSKGKGTEFERLENWGTEMPKTLA